MDKKNIPSPYKDVLKALKFVCFIEIKPNSDHFHQVVLTESQLNRLENFLRFNIFSKVGDSFRVVTKDNECHFFDNIQEFCSEKELSDMSNKSSFKLK